MPRRTTWDVPDRGQRPRVGGDGGEPLCAPRVVPVSARLEAPMDRRWARGVPLHAIRHPTSTAFMPRLTKPSRTGSMPVSLAMRSPGGPCAPACGRWVSHSGPARGLCRELRDRRAPARRRRTDALLAHVRDALRGDAVRRLRRAQAPAHPARSHGTRQPVPVPAGRGRLLRPRAGRSRRPGRPRRRHAAPCGGSLVGHGPFWV